MALGEHLQGDRRRQYRARCVVAAKAFGVQQYAVVIRWVYLAMLDWEIKIRFVHVFRYVVDTRDARDNAVVPGAQGRR